MLCTATILILKRSLLSEKKLNLRSFEKDAFSFDARNNCKKQYNFVSEFFSVSKTIIAHNYDLVTPFIII